MINFFWSQLISIDFRKQMMDFLVQIATACHISPAHHTFLVVSPQTGRNIDYLASQAVGSVGKYKKPEKHTTVFQTSSLGYHFEFF